MHHRRQYRHECGRQSGAALRHGARNVLGLEVVLADGAIVRSLNKMMKNNAGYDWTQMFIGAKALSAS